MPNNVPKLQSEYARIASQFEAAKKLQNAAPRPAMTKAQDAAIQRRRERAFKAKHAWLMAWLAVLMSVCPTAPDESDGTGRCTSSASTSSRTASSSPASS
jgi:hypothetical protein